MRIAVVMSLYSPWTRQTAIQLSRLGHDVHVVALESENKSYIESILRLHQRDLGFFEEAIQKVHLFKVGNLRIFSWIRISLAMRKILLANRIDMVLALYGGMNAFLSFASCIRPYAVYVVGSDILAPKGLTRFLTRLSLHSAVAVFSNGLYLSKKATELAPNAEITPLYLGVDTRRFQPGTPTGGPMRIICTRGFAGVYNNEFIIQALSHMSVDRNDWEIVFTSAGPTLESAIELADRCLPSKIRRRVIFRRGVTSDELLYYLQQSHIYVSMSLSDGTSISLLEALACGLFPVLSDIPQNREWISRRNGNGILVNCDEPRKLAAGLETAMVDEDLRRHAAVINREQICKRAEAGHNMTILAEALEHLARKR